MDTPSTSFGSDAAGREQRRTTAYNALIAGGYSKGQALTMVAMASIETNDLILMTRTDPTIITPECMPTCIRVGLEPDYQVQGNVTIDQRTDGTVIDPDWYSDDEGMQMMQYALSVRKSTTVPSVWVHPIDFTTEWNHTNQTPFEWALINKKYNLLKQWDMGPIFMRCRGMGPVASAIGGQQVKGFPETVYDMTLLYASQMYVDAFNNGARWWMPPYYTGAYPGDDPSNTDLAARYAGRQLGVPATDSKATAYGASLLARINSLIASV